MFLSLDTQWLFTPHYNTNCKGSAFDLFDLDNLTKSVLHYEGPYNEVAIPGFSSDGQLSAVASACNGQSESILLWHLGNLDRTATLQKTTPIQMSERDDISDPNHLSDAEPGGSLLMLRLRARRTSGTRGNPTPLLGSCRMPKLAGMESLQFNNQGDRLFGVTRNQMWSCRLYTGQDSTNRSLGRRRSTKPLGSTPEELSRSRLYEGKPTGTPTEREPGLA